MQRFSLISKKSENGEEHVSVCSEETLVRKLKNETKAGFITKLRDARLYSGYTSRSLLQQIQRIYPSVVYAKKKDGRYFFQQYNGVVLLEVNHLRDDDDISHVKQIASQQRQTWMAFKGCEGKSVVILVRYSYPDGTLPLEKAQAEIFHECAYMDACLSYQKILNHPVDVQPSTIHRFFYRSLDEDLYYNSASEIVSLLQPIGQPDYLSFERSMRMMAQRCIHPSPQSKQIDIRLQYEMALQLAECDYERNKEIESNDLTALMVLIARRCRSAGIPEEEAVNRTWFHYDRDWSKEQIRSLFYNEYRSLRKFPQKDALTPSQRALFQLDEFMGRRYVLRWNTLNDQREYRERLSTRPTFQAVTDSVLKMMTQEALYEGIRVWDRDVIRYVFSERIPQYNPIEDYLHRDSVWNWDGKDYIRAFAKRVPTKDLQWPDRFYRFMLGMVAQWIHPEKDHAHATTIILTGPQGIHKSTFFNLLLPEELRFGYKDHLDFKNEKDALRSMSRYLLINIDEFDRITERQQTLLKFILQETKVNIRLTNDREDSSLPRMASLVGTSNVGQLLTDPTGSRRFICVEVDGVIDVESPINYEQLYAQALYAVIHGERTYFTKEEEEQLQKDNKRFYVQDPIEDLFYEYYTLPVSAEDGEWMRISEIITDISEKGHVSFQSMKSIRKLGIIMKSAGFKFQHSRIGNKYFVKKLY